MQQRALLVRDLTQVANQSLAVDGDRHRDVKDVAGLKHCRTIVHLLESDFRRMLDPDGDFVFGSQVVEVYLSGSRGKIGQGDTDDEVDLALGISEFQIVRGVV